MSAAGQAGVPRRRWTFKRSFTETRKTMTKSDPTRRECNCLISSNILSYVIHMVRATPVLLTLPFVVVALLNADAGTDPVLNAKMEETIARVRTEKSAVGRDKAAEHLADLT